VLDTHGVGVAPPCCLVLCWRGHHHITSSYSSSSVGAAATVVVVGGPAAVDDHLRHGDLARLALACLHDLLGVLVVDGVQDQLRQREQHAQPVGDLHARSYIGTCVHDR
jgi:hypothetical protein